MSIKETQENLLSLFGDAATDEVKAAIDGLSGYVSNDDANARAASERKRGERKLSEFQAKYDELESQYDSLKQSASAGSDGDNKALELLKAENQGLKSQLESAKDSLTQTERKAILGSVTAGINFMDGVDKDVRDFAIQKHFDGLSAEDLRDPALVDPLVKSFKETNAAIIQASGGVGGGTSGGAGGPGGSSKITRESISSGDWTSERADAAWSAARAGEIE